MSKKKKTLVAMFAVLGIVALGMGAFVYAKYVSTVTGQGTAQVAKWEFRTANEGKTDLIKCELGKTYNAATLANGKIAPGTEGRCTIKVSNGEGQVGVNYTIAVAASGKPTNLKFYTASPVMIYVKGTTAATVPAPVIKKLENVVDGVKISWDKVSGAAQYRVFYKSKNNWTKLCDTASDSVIDSDVVSGNTYTFTVRALDKNGNHISDYDHTGSTIRYIAAPSFSLSNAAKG